MPAAQFPSLPPELHLRIVDALLLFDPDSGANEVEEVEQGWGEEAERIAKEVFRENERSAVSIGQK